MFLRIFALLFSLVSLSSASPFHGPDRRQDLPKPVISTDFPDPSIIKDNGTWFAFGTQSLFDYKDIKVQMAVSADFEEWTLIKGWDALGIPAPWVDIKNPQVWAPDVFRREDGMYMLYYSAKVDIDDGSWVHCIGTAIADNVQGPFFSNSDKPFACPIERGGAIDASAFRDDDGSRYVVYKIDGNSKGNGGVCGNTVEPLASTPIMIQEVDEDWTTPLGEPIQLLDRDDIDGPLIEAPAMIKKGGTYYLFFSSNCYYTALYDTSYATSSSPTGGFVKARFPLLIKGTLPETAGPGHADVDYDGVHMAFHAYATEDDVGGRRAMFVKRLDVGKELVAIRR